ncbi:MAG: TonB-dependent receptor [candidate division KSB1 bacterium]|nr:TonB-dependent receptor [candidate division KSB1 bacterium]
MQLQTDWSLPANQYVILGIDTWQKELDSRRKKHMRIDVLDPDNGSVVKSIDQTLAERPLPLSTYYSTGVYAQDEVPLLQDRIKLTLGGRWDWIRVENDKTLNPVYIVQNGQRIDSPPTQTVLWKENTVNNHSWSGNLGLLFHATPSTDFTFTAARSFRSPYISERYQYIDLGNLVKVGNPNLKPENGMFTDVGIRVWKDKISFSANAFYNRITDMVIEKASTYEGRNALLKSNVGKAELYGGEVRTDYRFYKQYSLHLSTSYVHGQDVYVDEPLPLIPPLNGRISLSGPVSPFLNFNIAATLYSEQERVAAWEASTPAYAYVDVYAFTRSFQIMNLRSQLFFGVENVLDTAYRNHLASNRGEISIEPGRNFMIRWELGI